MTVCRGCRSSRLHLFLPLGLHPLANGFLRLEQLAGGESLFPLDTYVCLDCGLIQIRNSVPPDFFRNYVYVPSTSDTMQRHFATLADLVFEEFLPSRAALTVDIGCNDGLFLKHLKSHGARTLGIDPATNIVEVARQTGLEIVNEYFTPPLAKQIREQYGPAAVVVTNNTFHHIDDLDSFTEGVRVLLDGPGVFIVEVPHALEIVALNQFDGIYHEHVSQFTVKSFVDHFRRLGLEVFRVDRLDVHGGSIRVFGRLSGPAESLPAPVTGWVAAETARGLLNASTYDAFRSRVEAMKRLLLALLVDIRESGRRVVGYGASARANTLLNYFGIGTNYLDYIVDRNSLKHGLYSPGMHIPVRPVELLEQDSPDYVLILAWNFAEEIMRQLAWYRERGGRFILPIPDPQVVA